MFENELDLVALRGKYRKYLESIDPEMKGLAILKSDDLSERRAIWNSIKPELSLKEKKQLANPFFIGYGDPKSDVLFLGKEKGFDLTGDHDLLLKESINNILQWQKIESDFQPKFSPKFPRKNFPDIKYNETWGTYCKIVKALYKGEDLHFNETKNFELSFFSKCFLSEINYQPSKYSDGDPKRHDGFQMRQQFLRESILPNFKTIIIGASTYFSFTELDKLKSELSDLFGAVEVVEQSHYLDRFINPFQHFQTVDKMQNIFLTTQLSGMNRWDEFKLQKFAERIKTSI